MRHDKAQRDLRLMPPRRYAAWPETQLPVWRGPTFAEFVDQVEHEFGRSVDVSKLFLTGLGRNDHLSPDEVKALCGELGVPAEDFGV